MHTAGPQTWRTMVYDSLGQARDEHRAEHTGHVGTPPVLLVQAWRYAYDDAGDLVGTSAARGCGENLVYDSLGRLVYEDPLRATATRAAYTPPSGGSAGFETYFTYDVPTLPGSQVDSAGKLTGAGDRATQTAIAYDARGRAVTVMRQLAAPNTSGTDLPFNSRYAPHWFREDRGPTTTQTASRPRRPALTQRGRPDDRAEPHESLHSRGTLREKASERSYGTLLKSAAFNPDGTQEQAVFGDAASTTIDFGYWTSGRLKNVHIHRPSGPWTSAAGYTPPPPFDLQGTLEDDLENALITYDNVGNLMVDHADSSTAQWPAEVLSPTRTMTYDDNYRVRSLSTAYGPTLGSDSFSYPPYAPEVAAGVNTFPPLVSDVKTRVQQQGFSYDWLGNTSASSDDQNAFVDRSLGAITNGANGAGPHQLTSATLGGSNATATYDASGNMLTLGITRPAPCTSECNTTYGYLWDGWSPARSATRSRSSSPAASCTSPRRYGRTRIPTEPAVSVYSRASRLTTLPTVRIRPMCSTLSTWRRPRSPTRTTTIRERRRPRR